MTLLSVRDAAIALDLTPGAVRKAIRRGRLNAHPRLEQVLTTHGVTERVERWYIVPAEIDRYRASVRRDGSKGTEAQKAAWREAKRKCVRCKRRARAPKLLVCGTCAEELVGGKP